MKFLELNKNAIRSSISLTNRSIQRMYGLPLRSQPGSLAPGLGQPALKFVVVRQKCGIGKIKLWCKLRSSHGSTQTIALFTDTDLQKRARKIARVGGVKNFTDEQLRYFLCKIFLLNLLAMMPNKQVITLL